LDKYGDELDGVAVVGMTTDKCVVDGWSEECGERIITCLGMMQQMVFDYWDSNFAKRSDLT
jgi:hypothetical protein